MNICIVIPAYNEELTIKSVVLDLVVFDLPVFVVDDGSSDRTRDLSEEAGATVISHEVNLGNGAALTTGLTHAFESGFTDALTLDADGAHRSKDLQTVIDVHREKGSNLTIGSRFLKGTTERIPSQKIDANRFAINTFNLIFDSAQTDVASGFRMLDREAFDATPTDSSFSWTFGCLAACLRGGLIVSEAPIGVRYDAQELWATSQSELEDFLNFCSQEGAVFSEPIDRVRQAITQKRTCSVLVGQEVIFIHPLSETRQVIFQVQNRWHGVLPMCVESIDFDAVAREC